MRRAEGFTLVELVVVIGVIALLAAILVPSFAAAKEGARLAACATNMRRIGVSVAGYAAVHRRSLPPFGFSDFSANLPKSGHWGGSSPDDPALFGRGEGFDSVNLWALVNERMLGPEHLICPSAPAALTDGGASYFPRTQQFSTYCLRFPYSQDLFKGTAGLGHPGEGLLGIYLRRAGGQEAYVGSGLGRRTVRVPLVRMDRRYRTHPAAVSSAGDGVYDVATDSMLADTFWWQGLQRAVAPGSGTGSWQVQAGWYHGGQFNVLSGGGSVKTVVDDGTIAANSNPSDGALEADGHNYGTYAERVWQFFDFGR